MHNTVAIIVPPSIVDVQAFVIAQMAPFYLWNLPEHGDDVGAPNPNGEWDTYCVGGRWDGWINGLEATGQLLINNMASTEHAIARTKIPAAIITPGGYWLDSLTVQLEWDSIALNLFRDHPAHQIVVVDART